MIDLAQHKASLYLYSPSSPLDSKKIEAYYSDELRALWRADDTRDWKGIYDKEGKFGKNWEGY